MDVFKMDEQQRQELDRLVARFRELCIEDQIDFDKFYLYSMVTHSTAIEGSTVTEREKCRGQQAIPRFHGGGAGRILSRAHFRV